jgi:hypothetical protein
VTVIAEECLRCHAEELREFHQSIQPHIATVCIVAAFSERAQHRVFTDPRQFSNPHGLSGL